MKPTQARLKELFHADPLTGEFVWIKCYMHSQFVGKTAGNIHKLHKGRVRIRIDCKMYYRSHLMWLWVHGKWPEDQLDHINGIKNDDRIANLREVTNAENMQNLKKAYKNSKTGVPGVYPTDRGGFRAQITIDGRKISLGTFTTKEEAHVARLEGKKKYHPFGPKD